MSARLSAQLATDLARGAAYLFSDWPNPAVPTFGAGVYTIWHKDGRFIYVGMSGRRINTDTIHRNTPQGIYTRLQSHASGRRSGDQFCVYVADRLVLPNLSQDDIGAIASGRHQMDAFVRQYIHENLSYRFVLTPDGSAAYAVEKTHRNIEAAPVLGGRSSGSAWRWGAVMSKHCSPSWKARRDFEASRRVHARTKSKS
jgi:hypothetical protein